MAKRKANKSGAKRQSSGASRHMIGTRKPSRRTTHDVDIPVIQHSHTARPAQARRTAEIEARRRPPAAGIGKKPGTKEHLPGGRKIKASIKAVMIEVLEDPTALTDIKKALRNGVKSGAKFSHHYLKLFRDTIDGMPTSTVNVNSTWDMDELEVERQRLGKKLNGVLEKALSNLQALTGKHGPTDP